MRGTHIRIRRKVEIELAPMLRCIEVLAGRHDLGWMPSGGRKTGCSKLRATKPYSGSGGGLGRSSDPRFRFSKAGQQVTLAEFESVWVRGIPAGSFPQGGTPARPRSTLCIPLVMSKKDNANVPKPNPLLSTALRLLRKSLLADWTIPRKRCATLCLDCVSLSLPRSKGRPLRS